MFVKFVTVRGSVRSSPGLAVTFGREAVWQNADDPKNARKITTRSNLLFIGRGSVSDWFFRLQDN